MPNREQSIRAWLMRKDAFLPLTAVVCLLALLVVGDLLLYSAAERQDTLALGDPWYSVRVHTTQSVLALGMLAVVATLPMAWWRRNAGLLLGFAGVAALLPFFPETGIKSGGAVREVALGPLRWEPGLILALGVLVWSAAMFARRPLGLKRRGFAVAIVTAAIVVALGQPDFSLIPLMLVPLGMQAWRAGVQGKRALVLAAVLTAAVAVSAALQPYVARRVEAWLYPQRTAHYVGRDYLLLQQGVAAGGALGAGYGQGKYVVQTGNAKTDYFFGHVVEELGLLRGLALLLLYVPILLLGVRVAERAHDRFVALLGTGAATFILTAVAVHIAVSLRLMPVTAIHLPFMSFGGTSLVASILAFGILLAADRSVNMQSSVGPEEETAPTEPHP
jgi:cell division protein FtsW